ncbi:MAG: sodium:proline symporter [Planctomycetota bacterium]|nr:MAG: sodium:proline symporter [Planctomycetota bacterium]
MSEITGAGSGSLEWIDWAVIGVYLSLSLGAGLLVARRAGRNAEGFFLSGRNLPWWLAGTSMVATSFAADTPLVIAGWTRQGGVAKNWRWWGLMLGTLLVVTLFARLWSRSRVLTDVAFMELRYSGRPARFLRVFKSVYQVVFMHAFVMGWVILGMTKVIVVLFELNDESDTILGLPPEWVVMLGCSLLALLYSEITGLWGVVVTDFLQFGVALAGAILLTVVVADAFGGLGPMVEQLRAIPENAAKLTLLPDTGGATLSDWASWPATLVQFLVLVLVVPFANKNVDGSGVMVQRLLAAKNEGHALGATLWYAIAHYAVRPWPWILVALASLLVFPTSALHAPADGTVLGVTSQGIELQTSAGVETLALPDTGIDGWHVAPLVAAEQSVSAGEVLASTDDERAYPLMMRRFLPVGLLGLLVASFLAAFMSTIDTHVNVASSYLVNDVYRRFLRPDAPPSADVRMARVTGPLVLALALYFAASGSDVRGMFDVFTTLFSGVGLVYVARWLWWRINAWSEISALVASGLGTLVLQVWPELPAPLLPDSLLVPGGISFAGQMVLIAGLSVVVVVPVTLLTPPVARDQLTEFVERVQPPGFWGPAGGGSPRLREASRGVVRWLSGVALVLSVLLLPGDLLLQGGRQAMPWTVTMLAAGFLLFLTRPSRHAPG